MNPSEKRLQRLQQVREEIERDLAQGITVFAVHWQTRYPDLEPELGVMLREMIARGSTQVAAGRAVETSRQSDKTAHSSSPFSAVPPGETIGSPVLPQPPDSDRTAPPSEADTTIGRCSAGRPRRRSEGPLHRRLRDHLHPRPGWNGRRLQGAPAHPQPARRLEDDPQRRVRERGSGPPVSERGRGRRHARPSRHRADL